MPTYCYRCSCGATEENLRSIDTRNDVVLCNCGYEMERDVQAESGSRDMKEFDVPIEMFSVGMNVDEVPAFRRSLPNVEVRDGIPIARTRQEKMQVLKYFGFQEAN